MKLNSKQEVQTTNNLINSLVNSIFPASDNTFDNYKFIVYESLLNYFTGEFFNLNENIPWLKIETDFFRAAFTNDKVYINYDETNQEFSIWLHSQDNIYTNYLDTKQKVPFDKQDLVEFKWPTPLMTRTYYLRQWADIESKLLQADILNKLAASKKFKLTINSNDGNQVKELTDSLLDPSSPYLIEYNTLLLNSSQLPADIEPLPTIPNATSSLDQIIQFNKYFLNRIGYTTMEENKKERMLNNEVAIQNHNTNNLQIIVLKALKVLSYEIKQKWNIYLEFSRTQDYLEGDTINDNNQRSEN